MGKAEERTSEDGRNYLSVSCHGSDTFLLQVGKFVQQQDGETRYFVAQNAPPICSVAVFFTANGEVHDPLDEESADTAEKFPGGVDPLREFLFTAMGGGEEGTSQEFVSGTLRQVLEIVSGAKQ